MPIKLGLIGKTNTGKTTFFNSATLSSEEISSYPFTTKAPVTGIAHAITLYVFILNSKFKIIQIIQSVLKDGDTFQLN